MADLLLNITLYHYLILALILFTAGFIGAIICRNVLKILISIEFMLTAVNINFIAFAAFNDNINLNGYVISLFYIALGAVEIGIALAIFYIMFNSKKSVDINDYEELKG